MEGGGAAMRNMNERDIQHFWGRCLDLALLEYTPTAMLSRVVSTAPTESACRSTSRGGRKSSARRNNLRRNRNANANTTQRTRQ